MSENLELSKLNEPAEKLTTCRRPKRSKYWSLFFQISVVILFVATAVYFHCEISQLQHSATENQRMSSSKAYAAKQNLNKQNSQINRKVMLNTRRQLQLEEHMNGTSVQMAAVQSELLLARKERDELLKTFRARFAWLGLEQNQTMNLVQELRTTLKRSIRNITRHQDRTVTDLENQIFNYSNWLGRNISVVNRTLLNFVEDQRHLRKLQMHEAKNKTQQLELLSSAILGNKEQINAMKKAQKSLENNIGDFRGSFKEMVKAQNSNNQDIIDQQNRTDDALRVVSREQNALRQRIAIDRERLQRELRQGLEALEDTILGLTSETNCMRSYIASQTQKQLIMYYGNNVDCSYIVLAKRNHVIAYSFSSFKTESGPDYVDISDGYRTQRYTGTPIITNRRSKFNVLRIFFHTDHSVVHPNINVRYWAIPT